MTHTKLLFCFVCRKNKVHILVGKIKKYKESNLQLAVCISCGHQREYAKKRRINK